MTRPIITMLVMAAAGQAVAALPPRQAEEQQPTSVAQVVDHIVARESQLVELLGKYSPRVETYIQEFRQNRKGGPPVIAGDDYFLGRLEVREGVIERSFLARPQKKGRALSEALPRGPLARFFSFQFEPSLFASPIFLDISRFNREHYQFKFVRREFLGEVRCLVFDLWPRPDVEEGGLFQGRIWVDNHDYQIVKTCGRNVTDTHAKKKNEQENLTPKFVTYREQIDNVYWFPTYTTANDALHFKGGDVQIRVIIKYTNYKRFGSETKILYNGQQLPTDDPSPKPKQFEKGPE